MKLYGDTSYEDINWKAKVDFIRASSLMPSNKHAKQLKKWLQTYFSQPLDCENIEISFCGLEEYGKFNSDVWMAIKNTCPAGQLMSYGELAQRSGYGFGASKVVGYAINKNPYMLVVGDHRVVKATGEIWCENESQRNKLRRLLVYYEMSFTKMSLDEALLIVKERNEANKATRKRSTNTKPKVKAEQKVKKEPKETRAKGRGITKKKAPAKKGAKKGKRGKQDEGSDEDGADEEDEDFIDDDDE